MACVIEEVDPASDAMRYEDALERILIDAGRDPTKFLAAVFAFPARQDALLRAA